MKARTLRAVLAAALFAAVFGSALREAVLTRRATTSIASVLQREADLEAQSRRKEGLLSEASRRSSDLRASLETLRAARERLASYEDDLKILALAAKPWREVVLAKDARLQAMYLEAERAALPTRYAAFVSDQGLSPEAAARFEAEEMAAAERTLDIKATAQAQGLVQTDPAVTTLLRQSDQDLKTSLEELLGADGYAQLQQFERTLPTRAFVDTLAGQLALTDSPLSAQQANLVVSQLCAANSSYQNGGAAISPSVLNYMEIMATQSLAPEPVAWDSIKSQVQSTLGDSQYALLDAAMRYNQTTAELYNMMKASSEAPMIGFMYNRKAP
jgi:hypothetical protein